MGMNDKPQPEPDSQPTLAGYARRADGGSKVKLSINKSALDKITTYTTSDGQVYYTLTILTSHLNKVLSGERIVTTISGAEQQ